MKKLTVTVFLTIALLAVMVITSCENNPVEPNDPIVPMGKLSLVPLGAEALAKVFVGSDGIKHLPLEAAMSNLKKMGRIAIILEDVNSQSLAKIASAMIEFGEINATDELMFVLMNTGNKDVFNILFSTTSLVVSPDAIGMIKVSTQGTEISALPIITVTKVHVEPISKAGSLLEMSVGEFTDTLNISYSYELGGDTVGVSDNYSVSGTKMGAIIDVLVSGLPLEDYTLDTDYMSPIGYRQEFLSFWGLTTDDMDTVLFVNNGNAPLNMAIHSYNPTSYILDTLMMPGDTINVSGLIRGDQYFTPDSSGQLVVLGDVIDQPYIFKIYDHIIDDGSYGLYFGERE